MSSPSLREPWSWIKSDSNEIFPKPNNFSDSFMPFSISQTSKKINGTTSARNSDIIGSSISKENDALPPLHLICNFVCNLSYVHLFHLCFFFFFFFFDVRTLILSELSFFKAKQLRRMDFEEIGRFLMLRAAT